MLALLALSLLSGCGEEDRTGTEATPANDRNSVATDDANPRLREIARDRADTLRVGPAPARLSMDLLPTLDHPLAGRVDLVAKGRSTSVSVAVTQGVPGTSYEGAIRLGDCRRLGPNVAALVPATADSAGVGASSSDISIPMDSLMSTPMAIVFGQGGRPSTCGSISPGRR